MSAPSFFFIPGAFSPASYYDKVIALLHQKGHDAHAIDLPSMDLALRDSGKTPGLYDDASHVQDLISHTLNSMRHKNKHVVLVANSYGTAVAFEACKGFTSSESANSNSNSNSNTAFHISHLILLAGLLADPGQTVAQLIGANVLSGDGELAEQHMSSTVTGYADPIDPAIAGEVLLGSLPVEERAQYIDRTVPICLQAFMQEMTFAAWEHVPTTLVIGDKDMALAPERQHECFDGAVRRGGEGVEEGCD